MTIIPGAPPGTAPVVFTLYQDGVADRVVTSGSLFTAADEGPDPAPVLTIVASNAVGSSGPSNALQASLLSRIVPGIVSAWNGTGTGSLNADGNTVLATLTDLVGASDFAASATISKRPLGLPTDFLANGRSSALFCNAAVGGQSQYFVDQITDNPVWHPMLRYSLGPGGTTYLRVMPRSDGIDEYWAGCFAGATAGAGWIVIRQAGNGAITMATHNNGVLTSLTVTAPGAAPAGVDCTFTFVSRTDNTFAHLVNNVVEGSGPIMAAAAADAITHPVTLCARTDTAGVTNPCGGNFRWMGVYHTAHSFPDITTNHAAMDGWFGNPALDADTGPVAGATVVSSVDVAVAITSIDAGEADPAGGWVQRINDNGVGAGLTATFVGALSNYIVATTPVMAIGGGSFHGIAGINAPGFAADSIANTPPNTANRVDVQLAYMQANGMLNAGRTLLLLMSAGTMNDLKQIPSLILARDHQGDNVRVLVDFVARVLVIDPTHDVRIGALTCTPSTDVRINAEIVAANRGLRGLMTQVRKLTGRPVGIGDYYTRVIGNTALYIDPDQIHLTPAGQAHEEDPGHNLIRYLSGRS